MKKVFFLLAVLISFISFAQAETRVYMTPAGACAGLKTLAEQEALNLNYLALIQEALLYSNGVSVVVQPNDYWALEGSVLSFIKNGKVFFTKNIFPESQKSEPVAQGLAIANVLENFSEGEVSSEVLKQNLTPFFEATGLSIDDMADERIATKVAQSPYTLLSREEVAELKNNNKFEKLEENVMHIKEAQELQNVLIQAQENPQKVSVGFLDSFLVRDGEYRLVFNKSDYLTSYYGLIKFLGKEKAELAMNNIAVLFSEKGTVFSSECGDCVFFTFRSDDETWVFIENKTSRLLTVSDGQFSTDLQFISLENLKRREKNKTKEILEVLMRV